MNNILKLDYIKIFEDIISEIQKVINNVYYYKLDAGLIIEYVVKDDFYLENDWFKIERKIQIKKYPRRIVVKITNGALNHDFTRSILFDTFEFSLDDIYHKKEYDKIKELLSEIKNKLSLKLNGKQVGSSSFGGEI